MDNWNDMPQEDRTVMQAIGRSVGMMAVLRREQSGPEDLVTNGTYSLVDLDGLLLVVTNSHVYAALAKTRKEAPRAALACLGHATRDAVPLDVDNVIADGQGNPDLVTFRISQEQAETFERMGKTFFRATGWPPKRPQVGNTAALVGFPALHRKVSNRGLEAISLYFRGEVSAVWDGNFKFTDENGSWKTHKFVDGLKDFGPFGGISGSAVYSIENPASPKLIGFQYEAGWLAEAPFIYAVHADGIGSDGSIC